MITVSGRAPGRVIQSVAGGVSLGAQPLGRQQVVEPATGVAPHRSPGDPLGAVGVAGPRGQGAEVGNHVACAHRTRGDDSGDSPHQSGQRGDCTPTLCFAR